MTLKALLYAYLLGGITFIPLVVAALVFFTIYTSVPVGDADLNKSIKGRMETESVGEKATPDTSEEPLPLPVETNDIPRTRKGWLTVRRTFEEANLDGGYVTLVRSFLDARSKDPKRSRPKDMWYVVLKGKVLYLYEDEQMTECEAAVELSSHDVVIYPEGLLDGELFAKRNSICLKPKVREVGKFMPSLTKEMKLTVEDVDAKVEQTGSGLKRQEREKSFETEKRKDVAREQALDTSTPWFIFVRSNIEMEDWYFALVHASDYPSQTPSLAPLQAVFQPSDMNHLVATLDEQPDVIPIRWLNALIGRIFFSYYRTHNLEAYIIGRLMKKLSKVKIPAFLTDVVVTEVSVGNKAPTFSKPMLKELTKEGDASIEVHFQYRGEFRITIEATATITLGTFKSYTVKLVLAAVLKELEGNLLVKVKRPPTNRIWYAFTQAPRIVLEVEPVVSDRQITWGMITSTIESRLKEIIQESVVMPNMDDITFFDSSSYQHRGGIWQDAARRERQMSTLVDQASDAQSTASAPVLDGEPTLANESAPITSQSTEELTVTEPLSAPSPDSSGVVPIADMTDPRRSHNRRRSWFSSVRTDDLNALAGMDVFADGDLDDTHRGRPTESDKVSIGSPRSQSTPNKPNDVLSTACDQGSGSSDNNLHTHLSPQLARRSSSQHSVKREHTKSSSIDSSNSTSDSIVSTPPKKNSTSNSNASSPNSFLSTLRSRAGDKQALSNTAKEAMRKWGVNWGGLRKESGGDDTDHGSIGSTIGSRLLPDTNFSVAQKARASYAEVRAAVAERKGRDRDSNNMDESLDLSRSSSPITIPEGSRSKARTASNPGVTPPQGSFGPSSYPDNVVLSTSTSSSGGYLSTGETTDPFSRKLSPSPSRTNSNGDEPEQSVHTTSIVHVQPKAKMMTIPGIHASHRGEIMSMGYNAPPQPIHTTPLGGKPSVQSVYRLWKNPGSSGDQQQRSSQQTVFHQSRDDDDNPTPPLPQQPRPVPPPLPPRSAPAPAISHSAVEPSSPQPTPPSASQTLKSIANKDERTRASLESGVGISSPPTASDVENAAIVLNHSQMDPNLKSSPNPGPPLPPRRI